MHRGSVAGSKNLCWAERAPTQFLDTPPLPRRTVNDDTGQRCRRSRAVLRPVDYTCLVWGGLGAEDDVVRLAMTLKEPVQRAHSLFYACVALKRPRTVCDVGSCDGTAAFRFRTLQRAARVIAFEANPENYAAICSDPRSSNIEVRAEAVSDEDGEATFYVLDVPPDKEWAKGASSLNRRTYKIKWGLDEHPIRVPTCRLDTALQDAPSPIALWVDVEGAAKRVVDGFEGIADRVSFICVELEPRALWEGQVESFEVLDKLARLGFREVARTQEWSDSGLGQINVVLTRDIGSTMLLAAKAVSAAAQTPRVARTWLRSRAVRILKPTNQ